MPSFNFTLGVLSIPVPNIINVIAGREAEREDGKAINTSVLLTPNVDIQERKYRLNMDTNFDIETEGADINKGVILQREHKHQHQHQHL